MGNEAAGFKATEIGLIPSDWEVMSAGNIGRFRGGNGFPITFQGCREGKFPFFKVSDMNSAGNEVRMVSANNYLSDADRQRLGSYVFPKDTIVFAKVGAAVFLERKKILSAPSCIDNNMAGFVIESDQIDLGYIYYQFQNYRLSSLVSTTALPSLNGTVLKSIKFPRPPTVGEQSAIAEALSDADALIESLEQLIDKKREIMKEISSRLLSGEQRLDDFCGDWQAVKMRDILRHPATYGIVTAGTFVRDGVKMIRGGDIGNGRIIDDPPMVTKAKSIEYKRTELAKDDVVIALVGYPGASAKIPEAFIGANISRAVGLLRFIDQVDPDYLVQFLNSRFGRKLVLAPSAGSAQQVVNLSALNKLEFLIPKLPEQKAISRIILSLDDELAALEGKLAKSVRLKDGMMQELLTGRIRLV